MNYVEAETSLVQSGTPVSVEGTSLAPPLSGPASKSNKPKQILACEFKLAPKPVRNRKMFGEAQKAQRMALPVPGRLKTPKDPSGHTGKKNKDAQQGLRKGLDLLQHHR